MERKFSGRRYIIAFVLTLIIFTGGIFVGLLIDNARLNTSNQLALKEKVNLRSLQLQQQYIDAGFADCKTLNHVLEENTNQLAKKMVIVQDYEKKSFFNEEEFNLQLQDYFLTEMQFLFTAKEIDQKCTRDSIKIIYFYDENKFDTQGDILAYLKKLFGPRVLVFSFNSAFKEEPMIPILLSSYKITTFPAVVVGNHVFQGHQDVETLLDVICKDFKNLKMNVPDGCKK